MRPQHKIMNYLAVKGLLRYETEGCPVNCREDLSIELTQKAIYMGPYVSSSSLEET